MNHEQGDDTNRYPYDSREEWERWGIYDEALDVLNVSKKDGSPHIPTFAQRMLEQLKEVGLLHRTDTDAWYEEDEEVIGHPHDPYHRVDVLQSSRHVKVSVDGEVVAETNRPKMLFESGLPPRYYIPPEDIRNDLLVPSETKTVCPYKGIASYRSMRTNGEVVEDLVWYYPEPLPEAQKVKDHLCFYDEKVDLEVDG